jgi:type IV fimbrial biogenesis protein FimT
MLKNSRGLTLIELIVGLVVMSILISFGAKEFSLWARNAGIRTAAEGVLSGLQLARTEALKGNALMRFQLVDALTDSCERDVNGPHWVVSRDEAESHCGASPSETVSPRIVQIYDGNEAAGRRTKIVADDSLFTFNGLGRLTSPAVATQAVIDVYGDEGAGQCVPHFGQTGNGKLRCLRVEVTRGGGIRLCDPALPDTDTQACS